MILHKISNIGKMPQTNFVKRKELSSHFGDLFLKKLRILKLPVYVGIQLTRTCLQQLLDHVIVFLYERYYSIKLILACSYHILEVFEFCVSLNFDSPKFAFFWWMWIFYAPYCKLIELWGQFFSSEIDWNCVKNLFELLLRDFWMRYELLKLGYLKIPKLKKHKSKCTFRNYYKIIRPRLCKIKNIAIRTPIFWTFRKPYEPNFKYQGFRGDKYEFLTFGTSLYKLNHPKVKYTRGSLASLGPLVVADTK